MQHTVPQRAFTLVELSIVLVILGLLVGGVLSGQSLIRAAELRAVTAEKDRYITALYAFKDKYMALPGDMPNAFSFWGNSGQLGCSTDGVISYSTTDQTECNGNGSGRIGDSNFLEANKSWMHLGLAGLIEGTYPGITAQALVDNVPLSKLSGNSWAWHAGDQMGVLNEAGTGEIGGIYLSFGNFQGNRMSTNAITKGEVWNIDKKIDDGLALKGVMRGTASCTDVDYDGDAANGREDAYSIRAMGADDTSDCGFSMIVVK